MENNLEIPEEHKNLYDVLINKNYKDQREDFGIRRSVRVMSLGSPRKKNRSKQTSPDMVPEEVKKNDNVNVINYH